MYEDTCDALYHFQNEIHCIKHLRHQFMDFICGEIDHGDNYCWRYDIQIE
jgi:hypothetical protein